MKKIIYLHGFGSSGATQTADYLRNKLPEIEVISPDIPLQPEEAIQMLNRLCYEVKPNVIVGTSMGAMYAQQLHGYKKILAKTPLPDEEFCSIQSQGAPTVVECVMVPSHYVFPLNHLRL